MAVATCTLSLMLASVQTVQARLPTTRLLAAPADPTQASALLADSRELLVLGSADSAEWADALLGRLQVLRTLNCAQLEAASRMRDVLLLGVSDAAGLRAALLAAPSWSFRKALVWLSNATGSLPPGLLQDLAEAAWGSGVAAVQMAVINASGSVELFGVAPYLQNCGPGVVTLHDGDVTGLSARRWNLAGCPLRVSAVHTPPFVSIGPDGRFRGVLGRLLRALASAFNFTSPDVRVGGSDGNADAGWVCNGSASGIFRDLMENTTDLAITLFHLTMDRFGVADMAGIVDESCNSVVVPAGLNQRPSFSRALLSEFPVSVWLCLALCLALALACSCALSLPGSSALVLVGILVENPAPSRRLPPRLAARLLFGSWVLAGLVLSSVYKGRLHSELSSLQGASNIHTLEEFAQTELALLVQPFQHRFLNAVLAEGDDRQAELWRRVALRAEPSPYDEVVSAMQRVGQRRDAGFLLGTRTIAYFRNKLGLRDSVHALGRFACNCDANFMLRKGHFLTAALERATRGLHEAGVLGHWLQEASWRRSAFVQSARSLALRDVQDAFWLLAVGLAAAAATCAAEQLGAL